MNESEFESELRALRPTAPSPALEKRIAAELPAHTLAVAPARIVGHPPTAGVVPHAGKEPVLLALFRRLLWAGAGAAVATVILLGRAPEPAPAAKPTAAVQQEKFNVAETPAATASELVESIDEGLIYDQDTPARQMRLTYLDRHVWTNPQTGAVIEFEVPREDVVLMPVAMQ